MNFYRDSRRFSNTFEYSNNSTLVIINYRIILRIYVSDTNNITSKVFFREEDSELYTFSSTILKLYEIRFIYFYIN